MVLDGGDEGGRLGDLLLVIVGQHAQVAQAAAFTLQQQVLPDLRHLPRNTARGASAQRVPAQRSAHPMSCDGSAASAAKE